MPLLIELPDASTKMRDKFKWNLLAQTTFQKPESLGDFVSNGIVSHDQFDAVLDGDPVVRTYNNFMINSGHVVTTNQRCKGMYLFIEGDLTVNGVLSMTARGAKAPGKFVGMDYYNGLIHFDDTDIFSQYEIPRIHKAGGAGANRVSASSADGTHSYKAGLPGNDSEDSCGGGGGGGVASSHGGTTQGAVGSAGTSFSGGPAGGGTIGLDMSGNGYAPGIEGGVGGNGRVFLPKTTTLVRGAGGGAGNPGGTKFSLNGGVSANGKLGTGGLMILIVRGNIIFGSVGQIEAKGSDGGNADFAAGGGSGGGIVQIFSPHEISEPNKILTTGGIGGTASNAKGGNGGNGSCKIHKVRLM